MPDENVHSTQKVALGFLLGLILSAVCFVIAVSVGVALKSRHNWVFPSECNRADARQPLRFKQIQRIGHRERHGARSLLSLSCMLFVASVGTTEVVSPRQPQPPHRISNSISSRPQRRTSPETSRSRNSQFWHR